LRSLAAPETIDVPHSRNQVSSEDTYLQIGAQN
jgi:hypothetical protein